MNYVVAAWLAVALVLALYAARALYRERALRRALSPAPAETGRDNAGGGRWP
jgi:hypothetical protein